MWRGVTQAGSLVLSEAEKKASDGGVELVKILRKGTLQGEILKLASEIKADHIYVAPKPSLVRRSLFRSVSMH